jgi:hypothetical protein
MWYGLTITILTLAAIWAIADNGAYAICLANHSQDYCYQELR